MNRLTIRRLAAVLAVAALGAACGDDPVGPGTLAAPTGLTVQQLSLTSVRVSWTAASGAETYVLQRASASDPGNFAVVSDTITGTQYDDAGLTAGLTYSYRVAAAAGGETSDFTNALPITTGVAAATLTGNVTASRTLTKDTVYTLSGFVKVQNGATLTVEAGTRIVGDVNTAGSSLWILRGAKLVAIGTAAEPIVFTSGQPEGSRAPGDWGGIVIVGNGTINRTGASILTEGPAGVSENYAGGNNDADSSGVLRYVRIEFAGYDVSNGQGQELNSLSLYAVGSGTKLEYVQSLSGLDDSFEFWGGAAQGRYLVSYESGDDHFDWSEGFRGKLQFLIAFQSQRLTPRPGTGTFSTDPRAFEADGCDPNVSGCTVTAGSASTPYSNPTISNFTLVGTGNLGGFPSDGNGIVLRRGTAGHLHSGIVARFKGTGCQMRDNFTDTLRVRDSLNISNFILAENGASYDNVGADTVGSSARFCQQAKWTSDNHRTHGVAAELFLSLNPSSLDFTPPANTLADTMTVTVALPAARAAGFFGGTMQSVTTYVGAADPAGPKWWQGWTGYAIN
jgi:hypothetical protein